MTYISNESGRAEIYVRPFSAPANGPSGSEGRGAQWQISTQGGIYPRWSADGREVFYIAPDAALMAVAVRSSGAALDIGRPVKLFETRIVGGGADADQGRQYDVSRDGRFLINTVVDSAAASITLLQNWKPSR
jgi:hypothetical protein